MLSRFDLTEMSRIHDQLFRGLEPRAPRPASFTPAVDVFEESDAIVVTAELPGVKLEDVDLNVENNVLTLRGERRLDREGDKDGYHRVERWHGAFARTFALPRTVDVESIAAELRDGVLKVRLPKRDQARARKIEVKA